MKLTRAGEYALHALAYLAALEPDHAVPSHLMAEAQGIPERFLLKVLKPLVSAGVLRSVKGPHGGYRLAKRPPQITVLEILEAVEGPIRGTVPFSGTKGAEKLDARLAEVCEQIADLIRKNLAKVRISELPKK
jgi:Rrf2 family protein